jgi:hypothetical protein
VNRDDDGLIGPMMDIPLRWCRMKSLPKIGLTETEIRSPVDANKNEKSCFRDNP